MEPKTHIEPDWLGWAKRLQAIAQIGKTFCKNHYDLERYEALQSIAAEIMAAGSNTGIDPILDLFREQTGYATPKVDVRGVVFQEGRILLVKELEDGGWTLPGGWADVCESPREAVCREIVEESGYLTQAVRLLAVYDRSKHPHLPPFPFHIYKIFIQCEITGGEACSSLETGGAGFFDKEALPELSISRTTPGQIQRFFEMALHPEWPADFD
jgi:ADP-ribose pyrophosphatase YjhB (NUDIX family)